MDEAIFTCETTAIEYIEGLRNWNEDPRCPQCDGGNVYRMTSLTSQVRNQVHYRWRCRDCEYQYTVRNGTVMQGSHIAIRHWCRAFRLLYDDAHTTAARIGYQTGVSYKSAIKLRKVARYALSDDSAPERQ